jgi:hypothetical protein
VTDKKPSIKKNTPGYYNKEAYKNLGSILAVCKYVVLEHFA